MSGLRLPDLRSDAPSSPQGGAPQLDLPSYGAAARPAASPAGGRPPADADELGAELEKALLRELQRSWGELNHSLFRGAMKRPVMRLCTSRTVLGRWHEAKRSIELSLPLLLSASWGEVIEVLKHEMAHQYVDEILRATGESAHGNAFRIACERIGIRPDASGPPIATEEASPERARVVKRVADLLALARSPNLHEAEAAATAAHRLMLKYNVELATEHELRRYDYRQLGEPSGRVPESDHILAGILAEHFFVEAIWVPAYRPRDGKRGNVLEICGSEENLQIASYVHSFLRRTAERLWREHRRSMKLRSNRDRRTFLSGVMEGFRERLAEEKARCREQGLVWLGDADLRHYQRARHPYVRHVRLEGHSRNATRALGRAAGRKIVLHRALGSDGLEPGRRSRPGRQPKGLPPARSR